MFKILVILSVTVYISNGSETPVVGILTQESKVFNGSYISASYVKYLESSGARVIPIWTGENEGYYRRILNYTNGILFPGGSSQFNVTAGYVDAAVRIYQLAVEFNKKGVYYPLWGTCLGMEILVFAALNGKDIRVSCQAHNEALPLDFVQGYKSSKLFSKAPQGILNSVQSNNVTYNYHSHCYTEKALERSGGLSDWKILSTNKDSKGIEFISAMESVNYPIYGVQFHPEKNRFEFKYSKIPHTSEAVIISQYFSNFFVDECRRNNNDFPCKKLQEKSLIYNYNPRYTGPTKSCFEQVYIFNSEIQKKDIKNWMWKGTNTKKHKIKPKKDKNKKKKKGVKM